MKIVLFLLVFFPLVSDAQKNRSANELAKENTSSYLGNNVFKKRNFTQVLIGELKPFPVRSSEISWIVDQQVETTEDKKQADNSTKTIRQLYTFRFYLDRKFEVYTSECHFHIANE